MLNQLTIRDYERRIEKFDFGELVSKETPVDIVKVVFSKVRGSSFLSPYLTNDIHPFRLRTIP